MKHKQGILERLAEESSLPSEWNPKLPIIEIAGTGRALVENHMGVFRYSEQTIGIRMQYGDLLICGSGLQLSHMAKEKLLICGMIDGIQLLRRQDS